MRVRRLLLLGIGGLAVVLGQPGRVWAQGTGALPEWPAVTREARPWTRWWWQGNAVNEAELTAALEAYREVGLGGVEITPIYGVAGYEDRFIEFLSDDWMRVLVHTLKEAERLDLGVDMATGTGWPFGGPWVSQEDASRYVVHKVYRLRGGERLEEPIRYDQAPVVRQVGYNIYDPSAGADRPRPGTRVDVKQLVDPVAKNPNLQVLALDQVRFPKPLPLRALMAYSDAGAVVDLTRRVDASGRLDWVAPPGNWTLYAVFEGWHGKQVERAAPGGEGDVIDHFSDRALRNYLRRFDQAFSGHDLRGLRGFFNDSYEVDDAAGEANWTPEFFEEFRDRRGYDLRRHLPALFGEDVEERNVRVLSDYRQTISELLLEEFTEPWREWARRRDAIVRNQAHGSPGNILDLYAAADIPETEGTELLRIKFASSAGNVTGKRLVSAEAATWLNEHFLSSLADVKEAVDRFLLGGVNHIVYHGTAYSPRDEAWPGWLFYAAVHFQPTNPWWRDFAALNQYVTRVQSFLQEGQPGNDVLLYYPIFDVYAERGRGLLTHLSGLAVPGDSAFRMAVEELQSRGYAFDFISDRQILGLKAENGVLRSSGGALYQVVVLPETRFIPVETWEKLVDLARGGAKIVLHRKPPADVPGLGRLEARQRRFRQLLGRLEFAPVGGSGVREARVGRGAFLLGDDLEELLRQAGVRREPMVDQGLQFVRRRHGRGVTYFIANWTDRTLDGWVPLAAYGGSAALFDPMSGRRGYASTRRASSGGLEVYLQLAPGESCIVQTYDDVVTGETFAYVRRAGEPQEIRGTWRVSFVEGGPELPPEVEVSSLVSWTEFGGEAVKRFSGTARYTITFPRPGAAVDAWLLDLGEVHQSARVRLNGEEVGTVIGPTYRILVDGRLLRETNVLEIAVSNLMANRIADMDRRGVFWKKFYNINFPARLAANRNERGLFDASKWEPRASGLVGPVTLTPVELGATVVGAAIP
jgi:hypothetical protein